MLVETKYNDLIVLVSTEIKKDFYTNSLINMPTFMQKIWRKFFFDQSEKIEITIQQNESWEFHTLQKTRTKFCTECGVETIFVPLDLGFQIVNAEESAKADLIANGNLHLSNSVESANLVCLQSLQSEYKQERCVKKVVGTYKNPKTIQ